MYLKHRSFCCVGEVYVSLNTKRVEKRLDLALNVKIVKAEIKHLLFAKKEMFTKHNNLYEESDLGSLQYCKNLSFTIMW